MATGEEAQGLLPYVPDLVAHWPDGTTHRRIDGTLLSADISGFTKLAEHLGKAGRVGGENLTYALNAVFTLLIDAGRTFGGDVLKFGGDAVLLLFDGDGHQARAAQAGAAMQRAISSPEAKDAAEGIRLRMSVGACSGTVDAFLVGSTQRELIVAGPTATGTARLEDDAQAGQVLVSDATATAVDDRWLGRPGPGGMLLNLRRVPRPDHDAAPRPPATSDVSQCLAPAVAQTIAALHETEGEHRVVTTGFVRFDGLDDPIAAGRFDQVEAALHEVIDTARSAGRTFGSTLLSTDIYFDGGKMILASGAPFSGESDEEAMLRSCLEVVGLDSPLSIRAGINGGRVYAGFLGSPDRRTYTVMGDDVNLAARLMQRAGPGEVIVTEDTLGRSRTEFQVEALPPFLVKGKSKPISARRVDQVTTRRRDLGKSEVPLIGRRDEIRRLRRLTHEAADGGLGAVVSGAAGSGKTRLLDEVGERTRGVARLSATCAAYDRLNAFAAVRPILRTVVGIRLDANRADAGIELLDWLADLAPELTGVSPLIAAALGAEVPETTEVADLDPTFRTARLHEAVFDLLRRAVPGPAFVLVEDAQLIDDASHQLLAYLAGRLGETPWLLCLSYRPASGDEPLALTDDDAVIDLGPLDGDEARQFVVAAAGGAHLDDATVDALVVRAGGSPLFMTELVGAVLSGAGPDELPESIESMVTSRIDGLPADQRTALREVAVLGVEFDTAVFRLVSRATVDWPALHEFVEPVSGTTWRFREAMFRDVAYTGLPFRHRSTVHAQVADVLAADEKVAAERPGLLSFHYAQGGRHKEAWEWAVRAGRVAVDRYASVEATELFQRALQAADQLDDVDPAEVAEVAEQLGDVAELAGRYEDADDGFARALAARSGEPVRAAAVLRKRAVVRERTGRYSEALRLLSQGKRRLDGVAGDDARLELARAHLGYAGVRYRQGRHQDAIREAARGRELAEGLGDEQPLAVAEHVTHLSLLALGDPAVTDHRGALPIFERLGELVQQGQALNNLGMEAYFAGRWDEAAELYDRSAEVRRRAGDVTGAAIGSMNGAEILSDQGHFAEAEALLRDALRVWSASGFTIGIALATSNLGRLAAREGRFEEADQLLADAEVQLRELGAEDHLIEVQIRRLERELFAERPGTAHELLTELAARLPDHAYLTQLAGRYHALVGDADTAAADLRRSVDLADAAGGRFEEATARALLVDLVEATAAGGGDVDAGSADAERAAELLAELGIDRRRRLVLGPP